MAPGQQHAAGDSEKTHGCELALGIIPDAHLPVAVVTEPGRSYRLASLRTIQPLVADGKKASFLLYSLGSTSKNTVVITPLLAIDLEVT